MGKAAMQEQVRERLPDPEPFKYRFGCQAKIGEQPCLQIRRAAREGREHKHANVDPNERLDGG
jgi:hypothetical protein